MVAWFEEITASSYDACCHLCMDTASQGLMMTDTSSSPNPSSAPWYAKSFGPDYAWRYQHRNQETAQAEMRALLDLVNLPVGSKTLDVCCGAGRHLKAALDLGMDAYGVDLSQALLDIAAGDPELKERVQQGDIIALPYESEFDAAFNLFTSFGYFTEEDENWRALQSMIQTLKPGGILVLDYMNKSYTLARLQPRSVQVMGDREIHHERVVYGQRVKKSSRVMENGECVDVIEEDVRLYEPSEMTQAFQRYGLQDVVQYGHFDGRDFNDESVRMITVGRKASDGNKL